MSRVGKYPVKVPQGTTVTINGDVLTVKGKLGELSYNLPKHVTVKVDGEHVSVAPVSKSKTDQMLWGTVRANIQNMVKGVTDGFTRKLELIGVGYKAQAQGQTLKLSLGYSHDINYAVPAGVKVATPQPTAIELSGVDKQLVGQVASEIRSYRSPEPYKGKGVKYDNETVLRKVGKKK